MMTDVMEQEDEYGGGTTDEYDPEEDTQNIENSEDKEQGEAPPEEEQEEGEEEDIEQDVEPDTGRHKRKRHRSSQEDFEGNYYGESRRRGHRSRDPDHKKFKHSGSDRSEEIEQERQHYQGGENSDLDDGQEKERRRHRRPEDREHKGKHRRHGKRRKEKSRSKARLDDSRSSQDMEAEDGEILEDGEIEEEGEEGSDHQEENHRNGARMDHHGSRRKYNRDGGIVEVIANSNVLVMISTCKLIYCDSNHIYFIIRNRLLFVLVQ